MNRLWYTKLACLVVMGASPVLMILGAALAGIPFVETLSGASFQLPTNPLQTEIGRWIGGIGCVCEIVSLSLLILLMCMFPSESLPIKR